MTRSLALNARLFWDGARLSYVALFRWLRPMQYLASKIFMPLAQILFFSVLGLYAGGPQGVSFFVIGNAMQLTAVNGIYGVTMSIGGDRWEGTLPYLFGTPANRAAMFLGRAFLHLIDGFFGVLLAFGWGMLLFRLDLSAADPAGLGLTILVSTFSTACLGLLMGCLSLVTLNVMFVNNTIYFLLLVFSGANVPVASLPAWMQAVSWGLPLTRGIAAARRIIDGGALADAAPLLLGELAVGAVYAVLGYSLFRWFEFQAKRRGTLEAF